jgi:hypothetical protein
MNTVNKTAKNIQIGDFVGIRNGGDGSKTFIASGRQLKSVIKFVEVLETTKCEINSCHKNIRCANGETYNIWSDATRYVTEAK